jgi:uncharacterized membrane-anchored protein
MPQHRLPLATLLGALLTLTTPTLAQNATAEDKQSGRRAPVTAESDAPSKADNTTADPMDAINWVEPGGAAKLGLHATFTVPQSCRFTDAIGAKKFLEATQNIPDGDELGVVLCDLPNEDTWFAIFSFDQSGYVKDDDKDKLDADAILTSIREGTEAANEERKSRGWGTMSVNGWSTPPFYDPQTHNLTWAINGSSSEGGSSVNHSVRMLGRSGVMAAQVVFDPGDTQTAVAAFTGLLKNYEFTPGNRYSEWRDGDKVASYGLTALVAGGAGVALAKTGLFAKLWKLIVVGGVALVGGIKSFFSRKRTPPDAT